MPTRTATDDAPAVRGRVFDADGPDVDVDRVDAAVLDLLDPTRLLWVDVTGTAREALDAVLEALGARDETRAAAGEDHPRPRAVDLGDEAVVALHAAPTGDAPAEPVVCVLGRRWIATWHDGQSPVLDDYAEQVGRTSRVGELDAAALLGAVLDWHLGAYFRQAEAIATAIDRLDRSVLEGEGDPLDALVALRQRIGRLRRTLQPHRELYATLARADFRPVAAGDHEGRFAALPDRLERALGAIEAEREMLLGSFDVHMSRTAQRTNEVMKALTVISATILPASLLASVLGMDTGIPVHAGHRAFWIVVAAMAAQAALVLVLARRARWI